MELLGVEKTDCWKLKQFGAQRSKRKKNLWVKIRNSKRSWTNIEQFASVKNLLTDTNHMHDDLMANGNKSAGNKKMLF